MKICSKCKIPKTVTEFSKTRCNKDGLAYWCKACESEKCKKWWNSNLEGNRIRNRKKAVRNYAAAPEKYRAKMKAWRKANPESVKRARRKQTLRTYGLTEQKFREMLDAQKRLCAICEKPPVKPVVDHSHHNGQIRAILCAECNCVASGILENPPKPC
jgi:recombination endonuclease VII